MFERITCPGVYDISAEEYHADPCPAPSLSSSIAKILISETPAHAWAAHSRLNPDFKREEKTVFDIGNAAHSLVLGDPKKFAISSWDSWQSKAAKEFKEEARATGKIPLHADQWDRVNRMVEKLHYQLDHSADFQDVFKNGKPEQTLVWKEGETWCRARLDWLPDDRECPYDDYKTTGSADPDIWGRVVFQTRVDIQDAFYKRGIRALGLNRRPKMRFVVQEVNEPHCVTVCSLSPEIAELGDREVETALRKWHWCLSNNEWPGYPAKLHTIEAPAWLENQRMARETRLQDIATREHADRDLLELGFRSQAPF